MIDNGSNSLLETRNRLNSLERIIAGVVAKDPSLVRCLEVLHTSCKVTQIDLVLVYHFVPMCNVCFFDKYGEYGVTPQREGPSMDEVEDARQFRSNRESKEKEK
jgi:hypothetical protein